MITENSNSVSLFSENRKHYKPVNLRSDYSYSYNSKIKNKVCPDKSEYLKFSRYSSGINELLDLIKKGWAISPSIFKGDRNSKNFVKCDVLFSDIDNTKLVPLLDENGSPVLDNKGKPKKEKVYDPLMTLEDALENEFIKKHFVVNTTASHTDKWHRFRLTSFLPFSIDNGELVKELLRAIDDKLGNVIDVNCIDTARLFYGNSEAQWFNDDLSKVYELPYELIVTARERLAKLEVSRKEKREAVKNKPATNDELSRNIELLNNLSCRSKGSNTYNLYRNLIWGLCAIAPDNLEFHESIISTLESLNIFSGIEVNFPRKIVGEFDKNKGINFGSFIYSYEELTGDKYPYKISRNIFDDFSKFQQWLVKGFNNLSKQFKRSFNNTSLKVPNLFPEKIIYSPNMDLPLPNDYNNESIPEFIIPSRYKHLKAKLKAQLLGLGWILHDNSFMGEGKSHDVSKLGNVLYLDINYKNPSIKDIEKMPIMPSRLQYGLYDVDGKLKADPTDRNKYQKVNLSNCHLKPVFRGLESKGYDVEGNNVICGKCPHNKQCGVVTEKGDTFGFKGDRKSAISSMKIKGQGRAHYKQIQPDMLQGDKAVFNDFTVAFEEAAQVNLTKTLNADVNAIDKVISQVTRIKFDKDDDKAISVDIDFRKDIVIDFLNDLRGVVTNAYEIAKTANNSHKYYGLDKSTILENVTIPKLTENEISILQNEFELNIDDIIPNFVGIDKDGVNDKTFRRKVRNAEKFLKQQQLEDINQNLEKLENNWFIQFINILFGFEKGTFRINKNNDLEVITVDDHHQQLANSAHSLLLLDATKSTRQLKAIYGINKPMMTFKTELPPLNNLKVVNVNMTGLSSNNLSDNCLERLTALKAELTARHNDNIAFLMPKKYCETLDNKYYFGKDDRGSNELMEYEAIAHFGKPMCNVGEAQIIYELYINDDTYTFDEYYQDLINESQLQGLGRSRVQHFSDKTFVHYFVGTNQDMNWLSAYGVSVDNVNVIDICEKSASKGDLTRKSILDSAKAIIANGEKLSQEAIAETNNFSQQLVSKAFKNSALSWKAFKNLLLNLYNSHKGKVVKNNSAVDLLELWLNEGNTDVLELAVNKVISEGMQGLIDIAVDLNASLHTLYRLLWLIAPLYDKRLLEIREKLLLEIS
jgi:hypothetical protein